MTEQQLQRQPTRLDEIVGRAQRPPPQEVLERSLLGAIQTRDHIIELFSDLVTYCQQVERDLAGTREALEHDRAAAQTEIALLTDERNLLRAELEQAQQEIDILKASASQRVEAIPREQQAHDQLDTTNGAHDGDQAAVLLGARDDSPR